MCKELFCEFLIIFLPFFTPYSYKHESRKRQNFNAPWLATQRKKLTEVQDESGPSTRPEEDEPREPEQLAPLLNQLMQTIADQVSAVVDKKNATFTHSLDTRIAFFQRLDSGLAI